MKALELTTTGLNEDVPSESPSDRRDAGDIDRDEAEARSSVAVESASKDGDAYKDGSDAGVESREGADGSSHAGATPSESAVPGTPSSLALGKTAPDADDDDLEHRFFSRGLSDEHMLAASEQQGELDFLTPARTGTRRLVGIGFCAALVLVLVGFGVRSFVTDRYAPPPAPLASVKSAPAATPPAPAPLPAELAAPPVVTQKIVSVNQLRARVPEGPTLEGAPPLAAALPPTTNPTSGNGTPPGRDPRRSPGCRARARWSHRRGAIGHAARRSRRSATGTPPSGATVAAPSGTPPGGATVAAPSGTPPGGATVAAPSGTPSSGAATGPAPSGTAAAPSATPPDGTAAAPSGTKAAAGPAPAGAGAATPASNAAAIPPAAAPPKGSAAAGANPAEKISGQAAATAQAGGTVHPHVTACNGVLRGGRYRDIEAKCRLAFDVQPAAALAAEVAQAALEHGRNADAAAWARKAIGADPKLANAFVLLGGAEQQLGHTAEARAAYDRYLELAPNGEHAQDVRALLPTLPRQPGL